MTPRTLRLATVVAGAVLLSLPEAAHRCVFPGAAGGFPAAATLEMRSPGGRVVRYSSADGTALQAAWLPSRGPATALAVYFHSTNQSAGDSVWFGADLADRGFDVLVPEHRGYGGLSGRPSHAALLADAAAAIREGQARSPAPLLLVGRSLGAAVAAESVWAFQPKALVLLSPFTRSADLAGGLGLLLPVADRFDTLGALAGLSVPLTVVHGGNDWLVPSHMGADVAFAHGGTFVLLPNATHNDLFLAPHEGAVLDAIQKAAHAQHS